MPEAFDAYHVWLGIPPEEQPPNCYRLLGIPLFEDRPEVIEHAADQRMAHLKSVGAGKHTAWAQRLLNEVAGARVRLLDPYKRAMYDRRLREELGIRDEGPVGQASLPAEGGVRGQGTGDREEDRAPVGPALPDADRGKPPAGKAGPTASPADQPTATWAPLGQLGDYQLIEKLGEGGMGTVYKAVHAKLGRLVALKVLSKDRRWDQRAIARFDREMKAVGAVDHPNIVRAMDAREVEGTRFLVMEYVQGADLNALARACDPISVADACEIVRQAALGLQEVHRREMVHRDVKPSNLMVTPEGVVKLLDLGLARFGFERATEDEVTEMGMAVGTVDYMAPEQVTDSRSVDIRADIYSLGCTLYKLLAGRTPFGGPERRSLAERLKAHAREPVPPIRQFRGDVPPEVVHVLRRMLEKDPKKRFSTPMEVADAVGPFATTGDLAALLARARKGTGPFFATDGRPSAELHEAKNGPVPLAQADQATGESRSPSSVTRFFQRLVGVSTAPSVTQPPSAVPKWRKNIPVLISLGAVGVFCIVALLIWVFTRGGTGGAGVGPAVPDADKISAGKAGPTVASRPTCLVLQWPSDERGSAMLEINGQIQDLASLALTSSAGEIRVPLKPGEHKVSVRRLGYEPFEQTFTLAEGKDTLLRPVWKESGVRGQGPGVGEVGQAKQPVGPAVPDMAKIPAGEAGPTSVAKPEPPVGQASLPVTKPQEDPILKRRRELAATWNKAMGPVEAVIAAWDFAGAEKAIEKVRFEEPELTARLAARREELPKIATFKQRIIERINTARPPLKKFAIGLTGQDGDVLKADHDGITAKTSSRGLESHPWSELSDKALPKVLQLVGPAVPDADKIPAGKAGPTLPAEDSLTAGMLALAIGNPVEAEKRFEQARSLGANIDAYLAPLAEAALARAEGLLAAKQFLQAEKALADLETKYAQVPSFAANKAAVAAAREAAKRGIHETEAEKLYAEAVALFKQKELFDLKDIVDKLKRDYANSSVVTDLQRKPTFAELEKAVGDLPKMFRVRLDGKGDFRSIQAAIEAAPAKSVIQIEDNGPYIEKIVIPGDKEGLTLRGRRGCYPIVTSLGAKDNIDILVAVRAAQTRLERVVLAHTAPVGLDLRCLSVDVGPFRLRCALVYMKGAEAFWSPHESPTLVEDSVIVAHGRPWGQFAGRNCLWVGDLFYDRNAVDLRSCTMAGTLRFGNATTAVVAHSIVRKVEFGGASLQIDRCDLFDQAYPIERNSWFKADPMFRDPANLDYRLKPGSPCIGKASDGGDIGCRYTPEMIELCKVALDLRRKGILKF